MHGTEFDIEFLFQPFQFADPVLVLQRLFQKGRSKNEMIRTVVKKFPDDMGIRFFGKFVQSLL